MNDEWIDASKELPPCDGTYWVHCHMLKPSKEETNTYGLCDYNGYGFYSGNKYYDVYWWKPYRKKRYGKICRED